MSLEEIDQLFNATNHGDGTGGLEAMAHGTGNITLEGLEVNHEALRMTVKPNKSREDW